MAGERPPRVYADAREEKSGIPELLRNMGVLVIVKNLPVGDYIVAEDTVVERKDVRDFVKSLFDGRLFDQARRLSEAYANVYYIIEGDVALLFAAKERARSYVAAAISLTTDYGVRLLWSPDRPHTAEMIAMLARRLQEDRGPTRIVVHKKPRLSSLQEWQLYIVQAFPGVGPKTAEAILERFDTLERFCTASVSELSSVSGLGEKRAETIKRILKTPYSRGRRRRGSLDKFTF